MNRFFNTSGLCKPEKHYMIDPLRRLGNTIQLIEEEKYFTIHAARQTGKTTSMNALMEKLNREGKYIALHFSCEMASVTGENYEEGNHIIVDSIIDRAKKKLPPEERPPADFDRSNKGMLLFSFLTAWSESQTKPIILLIDEIDSLNDLTLLSILRQLRNGYQDRPQSFPHSVALIGVKDVRDYKVKLRNEFKSMGTASPFNIKDESLRLRNFSREEVEELYIQHTEVTDQQFTQDALEASFYYSQGQPWLVNALARQCCSRSPKADTMETIDQDDIVTAKEKLILRRDIHIDSLLDKLKQPIVKKILAPILAGDLLDYDNMDDDILYVHDLGLVIDTPSIVIANPIYQEVIPRALNNAIQKTIPITFNTWLDDEGKLDWNTTWDQFLMFWREHGEPLMKLAPYHEIAPHLVLMAYLQRIANGGGEIIREYALGTKRIDLLVKWSYTVDGKRQLQKEAIELKVWRKSNPVKQGLKQLKAYLDRLSMDRGTLIIFNRRKKFLPFQERVTRKHITFEEKRIQLIRA